MGQATLSMRTSFKEKVLAKVKKFTIKHRRLSFLGVAFAVMFLTVYNIYSYFSHNVKRFSCLASIMLFYIASSSFTYPAPLALNVSFAAQSEKTYDLESYETQTIESAEIAESDAELSTISVDEEALEDTSVAEEEEMTIVEGEVIDDEQTSLEEILVNNEDLDSNVVVEEAATNVKFSRDDWKLILVNKQHPIPDDYDFPLGDITDTMHCDERIIGTLTAMMQAAADDGVSLIICSPYRNSNRQTNLFEAKITAYMEAGMSYMDSYNLASQAVTVPGSSEHQIGLALDIITNNYSLLDEGFGETEAGKWLADNSYKYGFILRYPLGKEEITGIEYEPWHFRYVGVDAATVIHNEDICLEEFWTEYLHD